MEATSHSLLSQAAAGAEGSWARLDRLYRPFLLGWFHCNGAAPEDAEDLTQEVMRVVFQGMKGFAHSGRAGAFRTWLRGVCLHRLQAHRRSRRLRGAPVGGTDFQGVLQGIAAPEDDPAGRWDQEHDLGILRQMLAGLADEFEEKTVRAFHRLVFDGAAASRVAEEMSMTVGAVYIAKSRVLRRLRAEAEGLIEVGLG